MGVQSDNTGLVWLSDISENDIDHGDQYSVFCRVSGIFDDGDNVGSLLGHVDEISSGSVGELDGVDGTLGSDNVSDVRNRGTTSDMCVNISTLDLMGKKED